jgi:hypothetical protein
LPNLFDQPALTINQTLDETSTTNLYTNLLQPSEPSIFFNVTGQPLLSNSSSIAPLSQSLNCSSQTKSLVQQNNVPPQFPIYHPTFELVSKKQSTPAERDASLALPTNFLNDKEEQLKIFQLFKNFMVIYSILNPKHFN